MELKFLGTPKVQYFDTSTNTFLNGGLLYAFVAGSSTPTNTYPTIADAAAGTNANANPVVLDSRGEANVVLKGATKLVLKDSSGNTIWTVDNLLADAALYGASGHIVLDFTDVASAVNYAKIKNSATGNPVEYGVAGTDTNVDASFYGKGTGKVKLGQATSAGVQLVADQPLLDSNANEYFKFTAVASAVNEITWSNAATGNNPSATASGGDTNVGYDFTMKGSGTFNLKGNSTQAARHKYYENTGNGTNYVSLGAAESVASNLDFTLPSAAASVSNQVLVSTTGGAMSFGTLLGTPATQAEMEAVSSTTAAVTPGTMKYHPGVAKVWVNFNGTGTIAIAGSYNVTSLTDNGTGDWTINYTTAFSGINNAVVATTRDVGNIGINNTNSSLASSVRLISYASGSQTATDYDFVSVAVFGDQ